MVLSCDRVDSGIRLTQVGDPLADGRDGFAHRSSSDRFVLLSEATVAVAVDEEAGESLIALGDAVVVGDITEGDVVAEAVTEGLPVAHDAGASSAGLRGGGSSGESKRRAEISGEATSGGRGTSRQGFGCGYCCSK